MQSGHYCNLLVLLLLYSQCSDLVYKMDEADSNKLRSNHVELIRNLNPEDVTDYLYQERVLTQEDVEKIDAGPTRAQKARIFVAILQLKSENALVKFLEALREGGYDELAAKLENPDMAANTAVVQASDSTELEELKEALKEQSEMVQAINKELEQVFDLDLMRLLSKNIFESLLQKRNLHVKFPVGCVTSGPQPHHSALIEANNFFHFHQTGLKDESILRVGRMQGLQVG